MANIPTNVSEKVFQIKKWLGVNEAPEGDARLKYGEAAVMENFRVTAGGALQKRPGTRNVAGLVSGDYSASAGGDKQLLITGEATLTAYPQASADASGNIVLGGTPVQVTVDNAAQYTKYYVKRGGAVWQLAELQTIGGGSSLDDLVSFSAGTRRNLGNGVEETGTQSITVFSSVENQNGVATPTGKENVVAVTDLPAAGEWLNQNVGGYVRWGNITYGFYGIYTEKNDSYSKWLRYNCTRKETETIKGYTEGGWVKLGGWTWGDQGLHSITGYTNYNFNGETGEFILAGTKQTLSASQTGNVYIIGTDMTGTTVRGTSLARVDGTAATYTVYDREVKKQTTTEVTYTLGQAQAPVYRKSGATYPSNGQLEAEQTIAGKTYTIMREGTSTRPIYYAYTTDAADTTKYFDAGFSWHGRKVTLSEAEYKWYFYPVTASPNEADQAVRGIWSGYVNGREVLCAACHGHLWELSEQDGVWSKTEAGAIDTSGNVHMFGFEEKLYILNGKTYCVWDGNNLSTVEGYVPLIMVGVAPDGSGTQLEQVNKLSPSRRLWLAPDGEQGTFQLPEKNLVAVNSVTDRITGLAVEHTADLAEGTITITPAPPKGVDTLEVKYTVNGDAREEVYAMRFAELYNGAQDSRVFIYGDGSNKALYSDLDTDGQARADYFPDLNVVHLGDSNTPLTALIRHYSRLLAFKEDSAYSIYYDTLGLADGSVAAAFYVTPVNRDVGNCAPGQAVLVDNRPRTLDGRSVIEWKATSTSGNISSDTRNAQRISQRVARTIREIDLPTAVTFYDKVQHEFYVIGDKGKALVHNVDADAWYVYTNFPAKRLVLYKDDLYYGTAEGWLRRVSEDYADDNGEAINAVWESGSMDFGEDYKRKYSAMLWVGIKPEDTGYLTVTAETDQRSDFAVYPFGSDSVEQLPTMNRIKLKAKKFTYYKLKLCNDLAGKTATVVSADIRVRSTGYVR